MTEKSLRFDNYTIIRKIGEGGFGKVFLAQKDSSLGYVALKYVESKNSSREIKALKKLKLLSNSQNFVPILDVGHNKDFFYYVMPLADSLNSNLESQVTDFRWQEKSLYKEIVRRMETPNTKWFSREEILKIITPIFDAAIELSEAQLLHRDIKPDNILFINEQTKLSDFGLLEVDKRSISNMGTPLYLAPSWYVSKGGNPDVYGLAATFYTLITGNFPDTIGRPAYRIPEKLKESISEKEKEQYLHWHRCILRAIAENPADRFVRIEDFKNAVLSKDFSTSSAVETKKSVKSFKGFYKKLVLFALLLLFISVGILLFEANDNKEKEYPHSGTFGVDPNISNDF